MTSRILRSESCLRLLCAGLVGACPAERPGRRPGNRARQACSNASAAPGCVAVVQPARSRIRGARPRRRNARPRIRHRQARREARHAGGRAHRIEAAAEVSRAAARRRSRLRRHRPARLASSTCSPIATSFAIRRRSGLKFILYDGRVFHPKQDLERQRNRRRRARRSTPAAWSRPSSATATRWRSATSCWPSAARSASAKA